MNQYDPNLEYCLPDAKPVLPAAEAIDPTDGSTCRRRLLARSTDPLMQTFTEHLLVERLSPEGELLESEETQWSLRWSYQQEMRYLLELCGFEVLSLSSDYAGAPPAYGSEQVWVCQKV